MRLSSPLVSTQIQHARQSDVTHSTEGQTTTEKLDAGHSTARAQAWDRALGCPVHAALRQHDRLDRLLNFFLVPFKLVGQLQVRRAVFLVVGAGIERSRGNR